MRIILASLLFLSSSFAVAADHCKFSAERNLDIDAAGVRALRLELGSSDAHVQGVAGLARAEIRGKACASDQAWLADLNLEQGRDGDKAVVKAVKPQRTTGGWGDNYAYLDLIVRVPEKFAIEVDTGSGDTEVANVASLDASAGSGDVSAHHVSGNVAAKVGSGDIKADDIGNLNLRSAGSGDVTATEVHGDVKVGSVGSGDLHFGTVHGSVQVNSIGSGELGVEHAGGDVVVESVGSGDVSVADVAGGFRVGHAGSGEIHHARVAGKVDVPKKHADD